MCDVIVGAIDIDFLEALTLTIDIELTILESLTLPLTLRLVNDCIVHLLTYWHWGQNYWPYYKKSIIIDKSQYIDIEENQDIVIAIDDGQWQLVNIDIGYWH